MANYLWFISQIGPLILRNGSNLDYFPQIMAGLQIAEKYQILQEAYEPQMRPLFVLEPKDYYQIYCDLVYGNIVELERCLCQSNIQYVPIWQTCINLSKITNNPEGLYDGCMIAYINLRTEILEQAVGALEYEKACRGTKILPEDVKTMITLIQSIIS